MNLILCVSDREPAQSILPLIKKLTENSNLSLSAVVSETSYFQKVLGYVNNTKPIHIINSKSNERKILEVINKLNIDFLISIQYKWVLSSRVIKSVNGRAFNFHYGKLPDYRGHHLSIHSILNNEKSFSTTCHWMVEVVDRGYIAYEAKELIEETDTSFNLQKKAVKHTLELFEKLLFNILFDKAIPKYQITGKGNYYSINSIQDQKEIHSLSNFSEIDRKARAFYFPPHEPAYFIKKQKKYYVLPSYKY